MGLFKGLFKSKPKYHPIDLGVLKTDVHSHLIPGIDDGAEDLETAVSLVKKLVDFGYKKIITTPHIMSDYYRNTPENINEGLEKLKKEIERQEIQVEISAAAEYYLDFGFSEHIENNDLLTFGDGYVLFELSYINPPSNLFQSIFDIQTAGFKPVLAHPERYPYWHNEFNKFEELKEKGVLLQINMTSLSGHYSVGAKKVAEKLIEENLVDFIGSDTHHSGHIALMEKCRTSRYLHLLIENGNLLNSSL